MLFDKCNMIKSALCTECVCTLHYKCTLMDKLEGRELDELARRISKTDQLDISAGRISLTVQLDRSASWTVVLAVQLTKNLTQAEFF